jgi:hypothetical protein
MLVGHLVYYLIHQEGMQWRDQDYKAHHIVKCVKNEHFKGSFTARLKGREGMFTYATRAKFRSALWPHMAEKICDLLAGRKTSIVPIPNSDATVGGNDKYKTLSYARALAQHSKGCLTAVDALRWRSAQDPQHKTGGKRDPETRFANMQLIDTPDAPVVLFDDFITSGASLIAAYWRLQEAERTPTRAFVIGRRTTVQHAKMTRWDSEDLDTPAKPLF